MPKKMKMFLLTAFLLTLFLPACAREKNSWLNYLRAGAHSPLPSGIHAGQVYEREREKERKQDNINRHKKSMMNPNGNCQNGFDDRKPAGKATNGALEAGKLGAVGAVQAGNNVRNAAGREAAKRQQGKK